MLRKFLLSLTTVLSVSASATHFSGGEIYWHCLGNNQYEITMVVYRDCAGINVDPNVTLAFQSPCGNTSLVVSTPSGVEISQLCDLELPNSTCNGGSLPGIQQYIYTGTITLAPCDSWTISYTNIYRNNAIVNLQNPGTQRTYIRAVLNTTVSPCNDSPQFSNTAIPFVCLGYPISYSFGAFDPEGDSLSYVLIDAMGLNGAPIPYVNPNTGNTPIPGLTLDPVTGQVNFTLATQGNWVVVVQVNHWVNGVLVGSIMRDMQFVAYPCTNDPPDASTGLIQNLSGTAVQLGPRAIQVCESGNFCFDFVISDPNLPNVLDAFSNIQQNLPGATFTFNGFNPITCTVCWNATAGTSGYFPFIVNVNDGACPIPAFQTYVYQVTVIPGLYGNIATTNASCIGNTDGTATASVTTGTAPFTYVWSTGATTPSIAGGPGSYTVTMTDVNNCVSPVLTGVISSNGLPNQANAGPDASACVNNAPISLNGSVVNATGGSWSGGSGGFSGTWPNITYTPTVAEISAGSVTLTLNTTGNTGCPPASDQMVLTLVNSFANTSISSTNVNCNGGATGTAAVSPTNPSFSYSWNTTPVQNTASATGLIAGSYTVNISDGSGCSTTLNTTITQPTAVTVGSLTATNETCAGLGNGSVTASGSGGTSPYTYSWSNGGSGPTLSVGAGSYTVTIVDANGCAPATGTIAVTAGAQPNQVNAGPDQVGCVGAFPVALNGSVTNATSGAWSGGAGSFAGTWPNVTYNPSASEIQTNGVTLTLTSVGNTGCPQATDQVFVQIPNSFANGVVSSTTALCNNTATGTATYAPTQAGITYAWSTTPVQSNATATNLLAGNYNVTVTDSYGCSAAFATTIGQPAGITLPNLVVVNESCAGMANGTITANASGGTAPYTYTWSNGATGSVLTAGAGTYSVSVTDANGCAPAAGSATINAAAQPNQANAGPDLIGCVGSYPVALSGTVVNATGGSWSGGNGSFSGTWPNVSYNPSAADITSGTVTLTLTTTGNSNCPPASDQVVVALPNSFANLAISSTNALCTGSTTGTASVTPNDPTFTYAWNDPASQSTANATALPAGTWSVTVTDAFGCTASLSTTVGQPATLVLVGLNPTNETCAGMANGAITSTVTGGTTPYTYTWSNGATTPSITAGAGTYTLSVTDANGCAPQSGTATINATGQPNQVSAGPDQVVCGGNYPVALQGSVTNATGAVWSGGSGTFTQQGVNGYYMPTTAEILSGGVTLTITTTGNTTCPPVNDAVYLALSNSFINAALTPNNVMCNGAANGSIAMSPALTGNSYQWSDPQAQTTATATNLGPGTYSVLITDGLGCTTTLSAAITQPATLVITGLNTTNVTCNGGNNGTANVQVSGGTTAYSYAWSTGQFGATITSVPAGNVAVTVTDANGCTVQGSGVITQPAPFSVIASVPDTICVNVPTTLSAEVTGGTGTINYNWGPLGTGDPITVIFTSSQTVQLSVSDQMGCSAPALSFLVHVLNLNTATFTTNGDTTICPGGNPATVGAQFGGYAGTYTITWPELNSTGTGPFTVPFSNDQDLHAIVTDQCGNTLTRTIALRVQTPPVVQLPTQFAQGCAPLTVNFPDLQLGPGITYLWDLGNGNTDPASAPTVVYQAGNFNIGLTVTTALGCTSTSPTTGQVIAWQPPVAGFTASTYNTSADNASIAFTDVSSGNINSWSWIFGDGGTSNAVHPTHGFIEVGTFEVGLTVTDVHGCTDDAYTNITITPVYDITIPTAFTPNGNGGNGGSYDPNDLHNDVFYAFVRFVKDFRMRVFNRWGELIFESNDVMRGWDGFYRDQLSPQDVYAVQTYVRFVDGKEVQKLTDLTLFR